METVILPKPNTNEAFKKLCKLGMEVSTKKAAMISIKMPKSYKITKHEFKENLAIAGQEQQSVFYVLYDHVKSNKPRFIACGGYFCDADGDSTSYIFDEDIYINRLKETLKHYEWINRPRKFGSK